MYGTISVPVSMIAVAQIVAVVVAATVSAENKLKERLENSCNYVPVVLQLSFLVSVQLMNYLTYRGKNYKITALKRIGFSVLTD